MFPPLKKKILYIFYWWNCLLFFFTFMSLPLCTFRHKNVLTKCQRNLIPVNFIVTLFNICLFYLVNQNKLKNKFLFSWFSFHDIIKNQYLNILVQCNDLTVCLANCSNKIIPHLVFHSHSNREILALKLFWHLDILLLNFKLEDPSLLGNIAQHNLACPILPRLCLVTINISSVYRKSIFCKKNLRKIIDFWMIFKTRISALVFSWGRTNFTMTWKWEVITGMILAFYVLCTIEKGKRNNISQLWTLVFIKKFCW